MTKYAIYFMQQWVGDHPAEWYQTRVEPSTAVVRAMQEAGIWSSRQGQFRQAMKRLGPKGCQRVRAACARLDLTSKGRGTEDPWILIERILLALAERRGIELLIAA